MSSDSSDQSRFSPIIDPKDLGELLGQGLDDVDPSQKAMAKLFGAGVSEDSLSKWRSGVGLKAKQFSVFLWLAGRSPRLRRWVAERIGMDLPGVLEDAEIAPIVEALALARARRDWPQIRDTLVNQLKWLGVYGAAGGEPEIRVADVSGGQGTGEAASA